jgi:DNA polymerase
MLVAMGASATRALTGSGTQLLKRRGTVETGADGLPVFITVHPSHLLRLPDHERAKAEAAFAVDLRNIAETFCLTVQ